MFPPSAHCRLLFSVFQVRWHGAKNHRGEGVWLHMLSEWGAGHRLACPCHRVKLQPYLPPKPAGRETTSPEGTDTPPPSASLFLSPLYLYLPLLSASSLFPCLIRTKQNDRANTIFQNINLLLCFLSVCVCVCVYWMGSTSFSSFQWKKEISEGVTMNEQMIFRVLCQLLLNSIMCISSLKLFAKAECLNRRVKQGLSLRDTVTARGR